MSEILMQAMVEKLESIELLLKVGESMEKDGKMTKVNEELQLLQKLIKGLPSQFLLGSVKLGELSTKINRLSEQLQKPLCSRVEHKHELHKGFLIAIGFSLISLFLTWGWINAYQSQKQFEVNDMKYRWQRIKGNGTVLKLYHKTDSLYQSDPVRFKKVLLQEEHHLVAFADSLRLAGENKKTAKR
jgi:hypothetical protein